MEPFYHSESTFEIGPLWTSIVHQIWHRVLILLKELFSKTVNTIGQQFAKCFCGTIFSLNYSLIAKKERISSEVKSFWKLSAPNSAEKTFANIKSSSSSANKIWQIHLLQKKSFFSSSKHFLSTCIIFGSNLVSVTKPWQIQ